MLRRKLKVVDAIIDCGENLHGVLTWLPDVRMSRSLYGIEGFLGRS